LRIGIKSSRGAGTVAISVLSACTRGDGISRHEKNSAFSFSRTASAFTAETDWLLEESGFEPLVPLATEMLIELARGITNATRMLAVGDIGLVPWLC
jgi:hypothetical protein